MSEEISQYEKNMGGQYRPFMDEYMDDEDTFSLIVDNECLSCYDGGEKIKFMICEWCEKAWCEEHWSPPNDFVQSCKSCYQDNLEKEDQ